MPLSSGTAVLAFGDRKLSLRKFAWTGILRAVRDLYGPMIFDCDFALRCIGFDWKTGEVGSFRSLCLFRESDSRTSWLRILKLDFVLHRVAFVAVSMHGKAQRRHRYRQENNGVVKGHDGGAGSAGMGRTCCTVLHGMLCRGRFATGVGPDDFFDCDIALRCIGLSGQEFSGRSNVRTAGRRTGGTQYEGGFGDQ